MSADARFDAKVVQVGDCRLWNGYVMPEGYGQVRRGGRLILAHRYAFTLDGGTIPDGMEVAHLCDNRCCVEPSHLVVAAPSRGPQREVIDPTERFLVKIDKTAACWLWTSAISSAGYGVFGYDGGTVLAHRFSYELHVGPIPDGLVLDHLCRVTACVNPAHLDPVTQGENIRRAWPFRKAAAA